MTRGDRLIVQGEDIGGALKHPAHRRITMKKNVWKYGLLSGGVLAIMMAVTVPFEHHIKASYGMLVGYTSMVLSFLIVFVGVKHYRDTECGGSITFGRAFAAGALMMLISCVCYVAMWEALNATVERNFAHDYAASMVKRAQNSGLQGAALEAKIAEAHKFEAMYSNPVQNVHDAAGALTRRPRDGAGHRGHPAPQVGRRHTKHRASRSLGELAVGEFPNKSP
jgi:hypothetical protein